MRNTTIKKIETATVTSVTCDRCKQNVVIEDNPMDAQEFVHIDHHAGFSSGDDGAHWQVDLCYDCAKAILDPYWRDVAE